MYKILTFGMTNNYGGVEAVIMNYYRRFNHQKIKMDFLCTTNKVAYSTEIKKYNGKIYAIPARKKNPFRYYVAINSFFKEHAQEYDCFWVNTNNLVNIDYLRLAKKYGIKKIIIHAHNSKIMEPGLKGKVREFIHECNRKKIVNYATDYWACSDEAANWFFDKDTRSNVKIIYNALNEKEYLFNSTIRNQLREQYKLKDNTVIGNIGRLSYQKNQTFLLDIFNKYLSMDKTAKLMLIGAGEEEKKLKRKVQDLKIEDNVLFLGMKSKEEVNKLYNIFDVFVFPSQFEGLGVVLLEAQANGLPILASAKRIPKMVKINNNFNFIDLDQSANYWAIKIKNNKNNRIKDENIIANNFKKTHYDIEIEAKKVEKMLITNL